MTQPTNIDYKTIGEQVEEFYELENYDDMPKWVEKALQERDRIAREEERDF